MKKAVLAACLVLTAACGSDDPGQGLGVCGKNWEVKEALSSDLGMFWDELSWGDGRLYFGLYMSPGGLVIRSRADGSDRSGALVEQAATKWWPENDRLLFTDGRYLYDVPGDPFGWLAPADAGLPEAVMDAGPDAGVNPQAEWLRPRVLLDLGPLEASGAGRARHPFALDENALYWTRHDRGSIRLSRAWRNSGQQEDLATIDYSGDESYPHALRLTKESVLLVPLLATAAPPYVVPKAGGAARALPVGGVQVVGTSPDGQLLWSNLYGGELMLSPVDGSAPQPFWPKHPAFLVSHAAGDGNQGWYVMGTETMEDGQLHSAVWFVDSAGLGTRIGCDPLAGGQSTLSAALSPTTVFMQIGSGFGNRIVAVARQPER